MPDEAALDFDVLGPSPNNPKQLHVLLVTCRQHTLAWYEAVLSQAGLKARWSRFRLRAGAGD